MGILFESKQEAEKYRQRLLEDGISSIIKQTILGAKGFSNLHWEVIPKGTTGSLTRTRKLTEAGIPPGNIITYYMDEGQGVFRGFIKPTLSIENKRISPHVLLSHEIAHNKLKHTDDPEMSIEDKIKREEEAWRESITNLKKAGEWNEEARDVVVSCLASYYESRIEDNITDTTLLSEESTREAKKFVDSLQ